jgi:tetratricopeptide (TPR) repeat protein
MKRLLPFFLFQSLLVSSYAQPVQEAKKNIYYHRYASAESILHGYLGQQSLDAEAWLLLTKTYLLENKIQKAGDSLSFAPASLSSEPFFLIAKGAISLVNNRVDSSRWYFDKAIDISKDPGVPAAIADMETLSENGDMNYALDLVHRAMKKDKRNNSLYVLQGNIYRKMHNGSEAFKSYSTAIEKDPSLAEAYYYLGDIFLSQKNADLYLSHFNKAIEADKNFGPAYYELYNYHVYTKPDAEKAMQYFRQYAELSDKTIQHDYSYADLLYLNKNYTEAIEHARKLVNKEGDKVQPRVYKLIAYSYAESGDTLDAVDYMARYFRFGQDSNFIAKDFETMAQLYGATDNGADSAIAYYQKAAKTSNDSTLLYQYYKHLASLSGTKKDYTAQAKWLGQYYSVNDQASNVDLFNWGIAAYRSDNYLLADSVFALYTMKYPNQGFGYYWRARTNAVIDSGMTAGLAIPHYTKLIEVVGTDSLSETDKKWVVEAYGYLATYEANTLKDYEKAIEYFDKILQIDPENVNAKKYIPILEASAKKKEGGNKEGSN